VNASPWARILWLNIGKKGDAGGNGRILAHAARHSMILAFHPHGWYNLMKAEDIQGNRLRTLGGLEGRSSPCRIIFTG
jgi:hypothetical protein